MIKRIDQQLYVNKRMVDAYDLWAIEEEHLREYMLSYLETITVVSTCIAYVSNDPVNLKRQKTFGNISKTKIQRPIAIYVGVCLDML